MPDNTKTAELADTLDNVALRYVGSSLCDDLLAAAALLRASEGRVPEVATHKNHLFDLRYTLALLNRLSLSPADAAEVRSEINAAITSMRYVISRTEAMGEPSSIPPHVMEILRSIHRRPSDCGIWLDEITMILRDAQAAPRPPAQQAESAYIAEYLAKRTDELVNAKRLIIDLHAMGIVEIQSLIEQRTGSWFAWGQDRDAAPPHKAEGAEPQKGAV